MMPSDKVIYATQALRQVHWSAARGPGGDTTPNLASSSYEQSGLTLPSDGRCDFEKLNLGRLRRSVTQTEIVAVEWQPPIDRATYGGLE
jgi:hypothetical protein